MFAYRSSEFSILVQIVEIEHPSQASFDRPVNEQGEGGDEIFESNGTRIGSINVSKEKCRVTVAFYI